MKKALRQTQTLGAGCSKAEPKISPRRRPLPGGAGLPKCNQLETVTTFTYKPSLVRIDACNFELSLVTDPRTNKHSHTPTDRTDYNTLPRSVITRTRMTYPDNSVGKLRLFPLDDDGAGANGPGTDVVWSASWHLIYAANTRIYMHSISRRFT